MSHYNIDDCVRKLYGKGSFMADKAAPMCLLMLTNSSADCNNFRNNVDEENQDENQHRYVGLVNQAMTCYLNSLIQTLYMTPEFRNAIYEWKFIGKLENEASNIPYQLQKLFLHLQTSEKSSLETKELTASFGWDSNEAYDQHDVQELCRIMFDALERRWRNSKNSSVIQDLYKGTMEDYVKCHGCGEERAKKDVFLDLPLPIKPFGSNKSYKSIEEALSAFIKPEELNGNNQYECEKCGSKQDAEKGLRITAFPKLLTIQLKRFDFDYQTLHRIKLNSRITFPDYLDVNNYIYKPPAPEPPKISYAAAAKNLLPYLSQIFWPKPEVVQPGCSKDADDSPPEDPCMSPTTSSSATTALDGAADDDEKDERQWLNVAADSIPIEEMLKRGPYVYELFSIMIHQGNATAGHYFAYIKNLDQNRWFCFNDSSVQVASLNDIYRSFGGSSYGYANNMNAYMLMYRKVDMANNKHFIRTPELPQHLKELYSKLKIEEEERERKQRFDQETIKIQYFCNEELCLAQWLARDPDQKNPNVYNIHKDVSLDTVFEMLVSKLDENNLQSSDGQISQQRKFHAQHNQNARLILCDSSWAIKEVAIQYPNHFVEMPTIDCEVGNGTKSENVEEDGGQSSNFVVGGDEEYKKPLESLLPRNTIYNSFYRQDLNLMIDTKPNDEEPFYELEIPNRRNDMRTYEVWTVDLGTGEIRIVKRVCLNNERTIEDLKRLLTKLVPSIAETERQCLDHIGVMLEQEKVNKQLEMLEQQKSETDMENSKKSDDGLGEMKSENSTVKNLDEEPQMHENVVSMEGEDDEHFYRSKEDEEDNHHSEPSLNTADNSQKNETDEKIVSSTTTANSAEQIAAAIKDKDERDDNAASTNSMTEKAAEQDVDEDNIQRTEASNESDEENSKTPESAASSSSEENEDGGDGNGKRKKNDSIETMERILSDKLPLSIVVFDRDWTTDDNNINYEHIFLNQACYAYQRNKCKLDDIHPELIPYNNVVTTYISVGTGKTVIKQYENNWQGMRKLIEYKKFCIQIRVLVPTKEKLAMVRRNLEEEEKRKLAELEVAENEGGIPSMNATTQTSSQHLALPRPVAIVPPTIVQKTQSDVSTAIPTEPNDEMDLTTASTNIGQQLSESPVVQEPVPTNEQWVMPSSINPTVDSTTNEMPMPIGSYTLDDPTPPPPYSSDPCSHAIDRPKTARGIFPTNNNRSADGTLEEGELDTESTFKRKAAGRNNENNDPTTVQAAAELFAGRPKSARALRSDDDGGKAAQQQYNVNAKASRNDATIDFVVPLPDLKNSSTMSGGSGQGDPPFDDPVQQQPMKSTSGFSMVCHTCDDVVMGGEQEEEEDDLQSGDDGEREQLLGDADIDDPMVDSYASTPKISPVVSEASGDESADEGGGAGLLPGGYGPWQEDHRRLRDMEMRRQQAEKQMRIDEKMCLFANDNLRDVSTAATIATTTERATTTTEMESRGDAEETLTNPGGGMGGGSTGGEPAANRLDLELAAETSDTLVEGGTDSSDTTAASPANDPSSATTVAATCNLKGGTPKQSTMEEEMATDLAREAETTRLLEGYETIQLVKHCEKDEIRPFLLLNVDKRERTMVLKQWLSIYLRISSDKFKMNKHYGDTESAGFPYDPNEFERIYDHFHWNNYLSVQFPPELVSTGGKSGSNDGENNGGNDDNKAGPSNSAASTSISGCQNQPDSGRWKRRERPLRIKVMSVSESDELA